jgi:hypothetical protein
MSILVKPQWDGIDIRRENGIIQSATLRYNIIGTTEAVLAEQALHQYALPVIFGNLYRTASAVEGRTARLAFEGSVEYEFKNIETENEFTFSFDTTGGTQQLTQSYKTLGRYASPEMYPDNDPPDFAGAIEVSDKGIGGCEVITPTLSFTMTRTLTGVLGISFIRFMATMTGRINSEPFLHWLPGEVLFEGASGSQKLVYEGDQSASFDVSYKFRVSPTISNLKVGDIDVGFKRGWDYFWVHYIEEERNNAMTQVPISAYIEQVYLESDLNRLLLKIFE